MKPRQLTQRQNSPGRASIQTSQSIEEAHQKIPKQWSKRWLKGDQYFYILKNVNQFCNKYGLEKYEEKTHPQTIYQNPSNGLIYFVKGKGIGSDFGFPRLSVKKKYRWKKMNFTTDLPKKHPLVTYVVASALKVNNNRIQNQNDQKDFRMHAVILYNQQQSTQDQYILCHVRQVQNKKGQYFEQTQTLQSCFTDSLPDFYKLFSYLHNIDSKK